MECDNNATELKKIKIKKEMRIEDNLTCRSCPEILWQTGCGQFLVA